jgi:large subunit ribosomal protein L24
MSKKQATTKRFAPKLHIKKGDEVVVISGDDKGKKGKVIQVDPTKMRALVEGVNIVKKHTKPSGNNPGGINEIEAPMHVSKLLVADPVTGDPTRIGRKLVDGKLVRYSKKSGEII